MHVYRSWDTYNRLVLLHWRRKSPSQGTNHLLVKHRKKRSGRGCVYRTSILLESTPGTTILFCQVQRFVSASPNEIRYFSLNSFLWRLRCWFTIRFTEFSHDSEENVLRPFHVSQSSFHVKYFTRYFRSRYFLYNILFYIHFTNFLFVLGKLKGILSTKFVPPQTNSLKIKLPILMELISLASI